MKINITNLCTTSPGSGSRAWIPAIALVGLLLCSFTSSDGLGSAGASGSGGSSSGSSGGGGGGASDDETVGTLPSSAGPGLLDILRRARVTRPSLYVQGPVHDLLGAFMGVSGDHRVLAQPLANGQLRLVFLGDVQVVLDRSMFHAANLEVGITPPDRTAPMFASAAWAGRRFDVTIAGPTQLPINYLEATGALDAHGFRALVDVKGQPEFVRAAATNELVLLGQSY